MLRLVYKYLVVYKQISLLRGIIERRSALYVPDNVIDLISYPCRAFEKVLGIHLEVVRMGLIPKCWVIQRRAGIGKRKGWRRDVSDGWRRIAECRKFRVRCRVVTRYKHERRQDLRHLYGRGIGGIKMGRGRKDVEWHYLLRWARRAGKALMGC